VDEDLIVAAPGGKHLEATLLEGVLHDPPDGLLVIDHEYALGHVAMVPVITRP
jgi:hypothetical protein